jgi:hypothetical protein
MYDSFEMTQNIRATLDILRGRGPANIQYVWYSERESFVRKRFEQYNGRDWHTYLQARHDFHPAVWEAINHARPIDWHQLVLEYPHKAESDTNRLAYTRDERAGEADKQTVTTIGKYLMRHFDLPDHTVRDIVAKHTCNDTMKFVHSMDEMVNGVQNGPHSCMRWENRSGVTCRDGIRRHPYEVYDPKYGWHMALRVDANGIINGRALCVTDDEISYWVRSYKRGDSYSYTDEVLEAWLKAQGYEKRSEYREGQKLALYPTSGAFLAPYIDGDERRVVQHSDHLCVSCDGDFDCDETGGQPGHNGCTCDDCGDRISEGEGDWVHIHEETHVCDSCIDDYTYAVSRRGNHYYIRNAEVVAVGEDWYDVNYLSDNEIITLEDGEYAHQDDAVYVESAGEYYLNDDDRIVCDRDGNWQLVDDCQQLADNTWALEHECWCCAGSGNWYLNDEDDYVEIDGEQYHPDHAPVTEESKGE